MFGVDGVGHCVSTFVQAIPTDLEFKLTGTFQRLSSGDPRELVLVQLGDTVSSGTVASVGRIKLQRGQVLDLTAPMQARMAVPDALSLGVSLAAETGLPLRIAEIVGATWLPEWGSLEGTGNHPAVLTPSSNFHTQYVKRVLSDFIGCRIVDVLTQADDSVGLVVETEEGSKHILWVDRDAEGNGPGWVAAQTLEPSKLVPTT
jgi:hypothetical protein